MEACTSVNDDGVMAQSSLGTANATSQLKSQGHSHSDLRRMEILLKPRTSAQLDGIYALISFWNLQLQNTLLTRSPTYPRLPTPRASHAASLRSWCGSLAWHVLAAAASVASGRAQGDGPLKGECAEGQPLVQQSQAWGTHHHQALQIKENGLINEKNCKWFTFPEHLFAIIKYGITINKKVWKNRMHFTKTSNREIN